jgi:membrane protein required for beta-lactamase induction
MHVRALSCTYYYSALQESQSTVYWCNKLYAKLFAHCTLRAAVQVIKRGVPMDEVQQLRAVVKQSKQVSVINIVILTSCNCQHYISHSS